MESTTTVRPEQDTTIAELVVPADLARLFHHEARDTLMMAVENLVEALSWDRKAERGELSRRQVENRRPAQESPDQRAEAIEYEREKVRTADAFLTQVEGQFDAEHPRDLHLRAERRHLYSTVAGCLLTVGTEEAHAAVESSDLNEVRAAADRLARFAALREAITPAESEARAA